MITLLGILTTLPPNPAPLEWSWTCGRPSIFLTATSAALPKYWRRWDAMTALFLRWLNTDICLPGTSDIPGRKKTQSEYEKRVDPLKHTPHTPQKTTTTKKKQEKSFSMTNARTHTHRSCLCVHSKKYGDSHSQVYSAMTQLNFGNKGCENLESKQESLPVIFRLFLSSFFRSLSLSLPCKNDLIFLAMVSLETCFQFIRMDCADVDDALTTVTRTKEVNGSKEEDRRKNVSFSKNQSPWQLHGKVCVLWQHSV